MPNGFGEEDLIDDESNNLNNDDNIESYLDMNRFKKEIKSKKAKSYKVDDVIIYNNETCKVIYGPYEKGKQQMYEIETLKGKIFTVNENDISKK